MIDTNQTNQFELRKAFAYQRRLPNNFSESDRDRFDHILVCEVNSSFIQKLANVKVSQYYLFKGVKLLEDFCLPVQQRGKTNIWKQWVKMKLFPSISFSQAMWVTDSWSKNYFHWILECLPRLFALLDQGIKVPLLIPEHLYRAHFIKESLAELQIEILTFNFRQTVNVADLYVVSHDPPCAFDPGYIRNVISRFNELDSPKEVVVNRKVYISRNEALKRKIKNESDLVPLLISYGFEIVQMEKLSFREQRELMRETKILMSIHGAGLTNLIFMPKESKIIELHPETMRYNSCFYHLAAALNLDYYYSFEKADHPNPQKANISVNLEKLESLLKTL